MKNAPSGTKRDIASRRHHLAILQAAMEVFSEYGYHAASLDEIAHRAHMSKGSIYCHFKNKHDLFMSVIVWGEHQLQERLRQSVKRCTDARECIEQGLRMYFGFYEQKVEFFRVLVQEKNSFHKSVRAQHMRILNNTLHEFETVVGKGVREGVFRDIDPRTGAVMISGIANGLFFNWMHTGSEIPLSEICNQALDFIKHGLYTEYVAADEPDMTLQPHHHTAGKDRDYETG